MVGRAKLRQDPPANTAWGARLERRRSREPHGRRRLALAEKVRRRAMRQLRVRSGEPLGRGGGAVALEQQAHDRVQVAEALLELVRRILVAVRDARDLDGAGGSGEGGQPRADRGLEPFGEAVDALALVASGKVVLVSHLEIPAQLFCTRGSSPAAGSLPLAASVPIGTHAETFSPWAGPISSGGAFAPGEPACRPRAARLRQSSSRGSGRGP